MNALQRLREQFWFLPAVLCLGAFVLAETLIRLDRSRALAGLPDWAETVLYQVGESGSRTILAAIATSSLAVAGTTFSITMAVLALTSSSYGPRLVRNFMADRGNQAALGIFAATFLYSLLVLRAVGAQDAAGEGAFVPQLAVNVAVLLAVLDVAVLISFIHHISDSVQIATLSRGVREDLRSAVDLLYPEHVGRGRSAGGEADREGASARVGEALRGEEASGEDRGPGEGDLAGIRGQVERDGRAVLADRSGYVTGVGERALLDAAEENDLLVALDVRPGRYVLEGAPLLRVHPGHVREDLLGRLRRTVLVADLRTPYQDVEFVVQQLTEMAVRALSPGTNDPYTAVNALDDLAAGLTLLAARPVPSPVRRDGSGAPRVLAPRPDPVEVVSGVLDAMRWYAARAPSVMHATVRLVEQVGLAARSPALRRRLVEQLDLLAEAFEQAGHQQHDVGVFDAHARRVRGAIMHG